MTFQIGDYVIHATERYCGTVRAVTEAGLYVIIDETNSDMAVHNNQEYRTVGGYSVFDNWQLGPQRRIDFKDDADYYEAITA